MNVKQFIKQHRTDWHELEQHLTSMRKQRKAVNGSDIDSFYRLYQRAAQQLSYSRTYFPNEEVTSYLNDLVSSSHNVLYKDQVSSLKQIRHFFGVTFVELLAAQWKFVLLAMALFVLGTTASFISVVNDPLHIYSILPTEMVQGINMEGIGEREGGVNSAVMSTTIMTNNIRVAILAFAGGITFGLLTVYVLFYNGVLVGALAALFFHHGMSYEFWALIVPHGMIELTAIFISGGAGLLMGYKLFVPGPYSRIYQLKKQAVRSVQLLLGTIPLFVIAGIIEGYITPANLSFETKYLVAGITVIGLFCYMIIGMLLRKRQVL